MNVVKELETQVTEINDAKDRLAKLETSYDKSKMTVAEKQREIKALEAKVKTLEKELLLGNPSRNKEDNLGQNWPINTGPMEVNPGNI